MPNKKAFWVTAMLVALAMPVSASAGAIPARVTHDGAAVSQSDLLELSASKKYHRLKPGCRASFCRPGYRWGDYRRYERRRDFGRFVAGVTLGAVIITAANAIPRRPSPDLCWYWANNSRTRGYWDYCY